MILGGLRIDHPTGPIGHSDGDVLLHAVTDALLGALARNDLGSLFPDHDPANEGRDSADFVRAALEQVHVCGYQISNIDATVIAEKPKLSPIRNALRSSIATLLDVDTECVNVKGKTHEGVDAVGRGEAIEAHAVVLLMPSLPG